MNCTGHCVFCRSGADEGLGSLPACRSCIVFPVMMKPIDARQGGCLLTGTMRGCSLCFFRVTPMSPVLFQPVSEWLFMTVHLSLCIRVLCASYSNMRVRGALMSAEGFSSSSRGGRTRASFKDEAPLQLSAALSEKGKGGSCKWTFLEKGNVQNVEAEISGRMMIIIWNAAQQGR